MDENERRQLASAEKDLAKKGLPFGWLGLILTIAYVIIFGVVASQNWTTLASMAPNEWGDFLAGTFGPLALLWVVLGFLQQGSELKNSRDALLLQAKELRHSVEAQRDLVGVARDQFAIDKDQIEFERKFNAEKEQPKLLLSTNGFSSSAPNLNFNLVLKNVGPTCTDIEVVANHELFHGKVLLKRNDLQKDESVGFQLQFPIERRRDEIPVHILYRDLSGFRHQMGFKVRVHDNHPYLDNKRGERLQTPHEPRTP